MNLEIDASYILNGVAKSWALTDQTTPEVLDSLNEASMTDTSTGIVTWTMTNILSTNWWLLSFTLILNNTYNMIMVAQELVLVLLIKLGRTCIQKTQVIVDVILVCGTYGLET